MTKYLSKLKPWKLHDALALLVIAVLTSCSPAQTATLLVTPATAATGTPYGGGGQIAFLANTGINSGGNAWEIALLDLASGNRQTITSKLADAGALFKWSPDGEQIAFSSRGNGNSQIYVQNVDVSNRQRITNVPGYNVAPAWSPDGSQIAFQVNSDGESHLYLVNADGRNLQQLTTDKVRDEAPAWSPDGKQIAFHSNRDGSSTIYALDISSGAIRRITTNLGDNQYPNWSPDGTQITFQGTLEGNWDIYVVNSDSTNLRNLTNNHADDNFPAWSPDGTKIAFSSDIDVSNYMQIYIMDIDGENIRRICDDYTLYPQWRP